MLGSQYTDPEQVWGATQQTAFPKVLMALLQDPFENHRSVRLQRCKNVRAGEWDEKLCFRMVSLVTDCVKGAAEG